MMGKCQMRCASAMGQAQDHIIFHWTKHPQLHPIGSCGHAGIVMRTEIALSARARYRGISASPGGAHVVVAAGV
eukprot:scaffold14334_cov28-Tisochrysis_lutea.AAC.3